MSSPRTKINILSISVALFVVILVVYVIEGYTLILYIEMRISVAVLCSYGFSKSMLKSPHTNNILLIRMSLYSSSNIYLNLSIQDSDSLYTHRKKRKRSLGWI